MYLRRLLTTVNIFNLLSHLDYRYIYNALYSEVIAVKATAEIALYNTEFY